MLRATRPTAPTPATVAAAVLASLLTLGGCRIVKGPWTANPAGGDTTAVDSGVVLDTAGTVVTGDSVAVVALAPADTTPGDTAAVGDSASAADSVATPDSAAADSTAPDSAVPDSLPSDTVAAGDTARADTAAARPDSASADTVPAGERPSAEVLKEMGPTYTPYDISPGLLPGDWLTNLLSDTLAPVVDRHDELSVRDFALFWVLVDTDGTVRDAVLHTTSDSEAFDTAARAVAQRLRYRPAMAEDEPVPVWILARVSLLMR